MIPTATTHDKASLIILTDIFAIGTAGSALAAGRSGDGGGYRGGEGRGGNQRKSQHWQTLGAFGEVVVGVEDVVVPLFDAVVVVTPPAVFDPCALLEV